MQTNSHSKKTNKQPPIRTRKRSDPFQHMSSGNSSPGDSTTPCKGGATSSTDKQKEKARVSRTSLILWHAHQNDAAAVRKLLEEDQSLVHARDYDNRTPLHVASLHGWIDVAKCLIEYGADVNAQDRWKNTVLFFFQKTIIRNCDLIIHHLTLITAADSLLEFLNFCIMLLIFLLNEKSLIELQLETTHDFKIGIVSCTFGFCYCCDSR